MKRLYTSILRQEDGTWVRSDMPHFLKEAKEYERINRVLGGIQTQIVPANAEEIERWNAEYGEVAA